MRKKAGLILVILGLLLIAAALSLLLYNRYVDVSAGAASREVMAQIETVPTVDEPKEEVIFPAEMTVKEIDGYGYIGYLNIEKLELSLPVMDTWDYDRLNIAPCRHFGTIGTCDLVIAGHNFKEHFGRLDELEAGDELSFTDMDGRTANYAVERLEILDPNAVDAVQYSGCDLVLYTCTYGGANRTAVFCNRK